MEMAKSVTKATNKEVVQPTSAAATARGFVYQIESDVPFPGAGSRNKFSKYPFDRMKAGDSFVVPEEVFVTVRAAAYGYNRQCKEEGEAEPRLSIRKMDNGELRVFRIA